MTVNEAIAHGKKQLEIFGGEHAEFIKLAIKALERQSEDAISRKAAIEALKKISFSHWFEFGEYLSEDTREIEIINSNKALEAIEALPSAQPERKKGQWMKEDRGHVEYCAVCDQCGFDWIWSDREYFNFCPNCGADMRGEQDE